MRDVLHFLLGDETRHLRHVSPTLTVLEYLRTVERLCGTKEGCAEGDCGACTVVLGEAANGHMRYRAVNACILFVPSLDNTQLLTVEHLQGADGSQHPVQRAMVEQHASQCGFCTPGFAMSLFAMHHAAEAADRTAVNDALAGNLCRCTGYRPIVDAALAVNRGQPADRFSAAGSETAARLTALDTAGTLALHHGGQTWIAPRSVAELAEVLQEHPDAVLLAGGTDVGLWVTKQHRVLETIVTLDAVRDMAAIEEVDGVLRIGAAAVYENALAFLGAHWPDFCILVRRLGSRQIRNRGTIGGNIGNASPIGDTPPALIALDATVVLRRGTVERVLPVAEFFLGYRRTALLRSEFIARIDVPLPQPGKQFRCYKVAKRFDQDISAVCAAFNIELVDGRVRDIRIGFGGMAATPVRVAPVEQALIGEAWTETNVVAAMDGLDAALTPISDMRASAWYRRVVARNLLFKFFLETAAPASRTRLESAA
ncbi:MAG: xanthine dehydrogenase small subunit [Acetobacteraceae bacterium]